MNGSLKLNFTSTFNNNTQFQLTDRILSIYSLLLIIMGTPCNLLCCIIYLQKSNRSNSIKTIFGYLALLDTIVPYTFNLNYVFREFNVYVKITYLYNNINNNKNDSPYFDDSDNINAVIIKKNLEEHSLFLCRFLSYIGKKEHLHIYIYIYIYVHFSFFYFTNIILGISIWLIKSLFINKKASTF